MMNDKYLDAQLAAIDGGHTLENADNLPTPGPNKAMEQPIASGPTSPMTRPEQTRQIDIRLRAVQTKLDAVWDIFAERDAAAVALALRDLLYAASAAYRYHHETICGHDTYTISNAEYRARQLAMLGPDIPDEAAIVERWVREQID